MRKTTAGLMLLFLWAVCAAGGCGQKKEDTSVEMQNMPSENSSLDTQGISIGNEILELEEGLSAVAYEGDYGFEEFLAQGGAETDGDVVSFLTKEVLKDIFNIGFLSQGFGCSTLSAANEAGGYWFGRNFDWNTCNAMIVKSKPKTGYASVSTVNMDFIEAGGVTLNSLPDEVLAKIALYAPLDGMNESGFAVSVNMIEDSASIEQNTDKPDLTTTTAFRLLLNQAATVDEAVKLLSTYDLHGSMGMMVHFAMADASGKSVVVEYIENEMVVTETPIVTNFYMAEGEKYGIGSSQSHERYEVLKQKRQENEHMDKTQMTEAMNSVSKDNFNEFESTEWTIIMNQETKELTYYHRENYEVLYTIPVK